MADLDRQRAARLLSEAQLEGLVLTKPEHVAYAIGAHPGVATMWRSGGGAIAIVPACPAQKIIAIVGDLNAPAIAARSPDVDVIAHRIWVDSVDLAGISGLPLAETLQAGYQRQRVGGLPPPPRPATVDLAAVLALLGDALQRLGLGSARLGLDLGFLPHTDFLAFATRLHRVRWQDGSKIIRRLRAVKSPREIGLLRTASELSEAGLDHLETAIRHGITARDLSAAWNSGVDAEITRRGLQNVTGRWDYISVGDDPWSGGGVATEGALIKADAGTLVEGYSSDGARSFVVGEPSALAEQVYTVLLEARSAGLAAIRPGQSFGAVYAATIDVFRRAGIDGYDRGHFGHSLGADTGIEEWPFISRDETEIIGPGMVLAFEVPFCATGFGALMIEDQLLVTATGTGLMTRRTPVLVRSVS